MKQSGFYMPVSRHAQILSAHKNPGDAKLKENERFWLAESLWDSLPIVLPPRFSKGFA